MSSRAVVAASSSPATDQAAPPPEYATLPEKGYIPTLDGWRALAFGSVLLSHGFVDAVRRVHAPAWLLTFIERAGTAGVMVFFAISGFLICTRLLSSMPDHARGETLRVFYIRRFFRIQPPAMLYLLVIGVAAILGGYGSLVPGYFELRGWLAAILICRNYTGLMHATSHFWSLAIEEQFYLVWPVVLVLFRQRKAAWIALAGVLAAPLIRWAEISRWSSTLPLSEILERTECRVDSFLFPCLLAILLTWPNWKSKLSFLFTPYLRVAVVLATIVATILPYRFPQFSLLQRQLMPLLITLLVVGTTTNRGWLAKLLEWKPLRAIGRLSYSLYLWQQIIVYRPFSGLTAWQIGTEISLRLLILAAVSIASYKFIEVPAIQFGRALAARRSRMIATPAPALAPGR